MQHLKSDVPNLKLAALAALWFAVVLAVAFTLKLPNNEWSKDQPMFRWQLALEFVAPVAAKLPSGQNDAAPSAWLVISQRLDLVGVAAWILTGAWGIGHLLFRLVRPPQLEKSLERTVFGLGIGLAALSLITLGLGLAGVLSRGLMGSLLTLSFSAEILLRFTHPVPQLAIPAPRSSFVPLPLSRTHWLLLATALPFLWYTLLGALLPSIDFDVNEYHFEGPKEFFQAGRISLLEHNVYTSFPFLTEMLTLLAMVLSDDWYRGALAGKALLMCFEPLTALALLAAGRRWFGNTAGVVAAILWLSTPWAYRISTIAYAEGGLAFYLFASLLAFQIAVEQISGDPLLREPGRDGKGTGRQLLLAGLLAGSAMACKYPGVLSVVIPLAIVLCGLIWARRALAPPSWKLPLAFAAGVAIAIGPWLLKNAVETGNPVYPLAYRIFGSRDWDPALDARWRKAHSPDSYTASSLADLVLDVATRNDWVNPLLFALAPLALFAGGTRRRVRWLWFYVGWLVITCWLFTHRLDRFWVPMLPVVALLAGAGAAWWWSALPRGFWRFTIVLPLAGMGLFHLEFITTRLGGYNDFYADLDDAGRYAARLAAPEIAYLNEHLPAGSKVLSVGDAAVFEARFPIVYNTVFDRSIFEEWLAARPGERPAGLGLCDAETIRKKLADERITHIYVCWREILRYRSPGNYGYTDFVTPERFAELQRLGILGPALPAPGGRRRLADLDRTSREAFELWGKGLIQGQGKRREFLTYQVFPVASQNNDGVAGS